MKKAIIYAVMSWVVLFLLLGGLQLVNGQERLPPADSINWDTESGLYIVKEIEVESMRQMFRDLGDYPIPWDAYKKEIRGGLEKACRQQIHKNSKFVGHIIRKSNYRMIPLCTGPTPTRLERAAVLCVNLNMRFSFSKPLSRQFACQMVGPPKIGI